jgi:cobalt/nickel transport system ATP-binding protein
MPWSTVEMIKTENLSFSYPDGTWALQKINLEVQKGEFLAIIGSSGCGKTTLLKHLIGLLKPSAGKLNLDGKEFCLYKTGEIFRQVGMVFQDPNDQLFSATVEQDVAFGVANLGLKPDEITLRIEQALKMVNAVELASKAIHTLSYGQKKRVSIAGVLVMEPSLILLDEPTSGLDPRSVNAIMSLLRQLNRDKGITMIMATHDVELVPLFCDRVAIMGKGQLKAVGAPESIFANVTLLQETDVILPQIARLFEILQKEDGVSFSMMPLTINAARRELSMLLANKASLSIQ